MIPLATIVPAGFRSLLFRLAARLRG